MRRLQTPVAVRSPCPLVPQCMRVSGTCQLQRMCLRCPLCHLTDWGQTVAGMNHACLLLTLGVLCCLHYLPQRMQCSVMQVQRVCSGDDPILCVRIADCQHLQTSTMCQEQSQSINVRKPCHSAHFDMVCCLYTHHQMPAKTG